MFVCNCDSSEVYITGYYTVEGLEIIHFHLGILEKHSFQLVIMKTKT